AVAALSGARRAALTLFPYTPLFRSRDVVGDARETQRLRADIELAVERDGARQHLPLIGRRRARGSIGARRRLRQFRQSRQLRDEDRKSTRLNSSHVKISYAVFCLKK